MAAEDTRFVRWLLFLLTLGLLGDASSFLFSPRSLVNYMGGTPTDWSSLFARIAASGNILLAYINIKAIYSTSAAMMETLKANMLFYAFYVSPILWAIWSGLFPFGDLPVWMLAFAGVFAVTVFTLIFLIIFGKRLGLASGNDSSTEPMLPVQSAA